VKRENKEGLKPIWLIEDEQSSASALVPLLKRIVGARFLVLFPSLETALAKASSAPRPEVILIHGISPMVEMEEIQAICPGALLLIIWTYDEIGTTATPLGRAVVNLLRPKPEVTKYYYGLTTGERKVLQLMVEGWIKKEIADRLSLSFHTVNNHERHIYQKLHVHTRSAAVAKAVMEGLVP
jgi:DNA-binding NarL/FixJ family response regulator